MSLKWAKALGFEASRIIYIKREADSSLPPVHHSCYNIAYQGSGKIIPAVWWLDIPFNDLVSLEPPSKPFRLSAIVSSTATLSGHRLRLRFLTDLASRFRFDVFGRGHEPCSFFGNYRGPLLEPNRCKRRGLLPYAFSVSIENTSEYGYITEKFNDPLLCFCTPLYYGAKNISAYYPLDSYAFIDISDSSSSIPLICEIIESYSSSTSYAALKEARELLLFRYNIWNIVNRLVVSVDR